MPMQILKRIEQALLAVRLSPSITVKPGAAARS
jgi:hypothetical protein